MTRRISVYEKWTKAGAMPRGVAASAYGDSISAPDFLSDSRGGDEKCAAADGFVPE